MIDDATLAEWEAMMAESILSHNRLDVRDWLKDAIAEIRRLLGELETVRGTWKQMYDSAVRRAEHDEADLTAHQAVVRDMTVCLVVLKDLWHKTNRTVADLEVGQHTIERGLALAHPLVQQAREKKP